MLLRALNMPLSYLSWFAVVQREIHGRLKYAKLIIVFALKNNHPFFKSHVWKCNVQANKGLTKVNGKWSTIEFDDFAFSLIFFVSVSHKGVINKCCMFYFLHTSNWWCMCWCVRMWLHGIKWRRLVYGKSINVILPKIIFWKTIDNDDSVIRFFLITSFYFFAYYIFCLLYFCLYITTSP